MQSAFVQLGLFAAQALIILAILLTFLITFFALIAKGKEKLKGHLVIKNLNKKFAETTEAIFTETLPKKLFKQFLKQQKQEEKTKAKSDTPTKNMYVLQFNGDIKASAVATLREEVTAILNVATPNDEVLVCIESGGGMVHSYGLATAQLMRLRARHIPLTVAIDKIAASGGYMMACVANKILAAPFAIIGSIGVIVQLPNFYRLLKDKDIEFEQVMSGEYKRTLTMFGENTQKGREKLQDEINDVHDLFKNLISSHRQQVDINKVSTGEHWLGQQALGLQLVDQLKTSDDYVLERAKDTQVFEIHYEIRKSLLNKFSGAAALIRDQLQKFML